MRGLRFGRCPSAQMLRPTFREGRPDVVPLAVHRDLIDSGEHGAEQRSDHVLVGFRDPGQQIPDEMNTIASGLHLGNIGGSQRQPSVLIGDHQANTVKPPGFE